MSVVSVRSNPLPPSFLVRRSLALVALLVAAAPFAAHAEVDVRTITLRTPIGSPASSLPVVTTQPQSVVVNAGQRATFNVVATSAGAMTYQWMRNGTAIRGATASNYAIAAATASDSGAQYSVAVSTRTGSVSSAVARLTVNTVLVSAASADRPFSDQSPWNARPSRFTFGTDVVPRSSYVPNIAEGAWSLGVFTASASDPAANIYGPDDNGLWVPDAEQTVPFVTIQHWPSGVVPAIGSDGHADIVDPANNKVHSFWQLSFVNGKWRAASYSWTALDGRGFGTPAQYMQGVRAAGVVSMAGLVRKDEVNDGQPLYKHALAMSLTFNALASTPSYTFPATSADWDAATTNSGAIPEGARVMIPTSFDTSVIHDARLLKIVRTLQTYGALVVDRNWGTPFLIYVENGSGFNLMPNGWDTEIASELDVIRAAMRPVTNVTEWVDANGNVFVPETNLNLLSMRGYWSVRQGSSAGVYDTQQQAVVFPNNGVFTQQTNTTGRSMPSLSTTPLAGKTVTLKVTATGGAQMKLDLALNGNPVVSSGLLGNGGTITFQWPSNAVNPYVTAQSGAAGGGTVSATLVVTP